MSGRTVTANRSGYTLIELVLVIVLMSLLTAMAVVNLGPALDRSRVRSAARVIASDLQYAQLMAVRQRKPVLVLFSAAAKQLIVRDRTTPTVFRTRALGDDTEFKLDNLASSASQIEIFPTGIARQTVVISVSLKGYTRQVRYTRAGQIRIQ